MQTEKQKTKKGQQSMVNVLGKCNRFSSTEKHFPRNKLQHL